MRILSAICFSIPVVLLGLQEGRAQIVFGERLSSQQILSELAVQKTISHKESASDFLSISARERTPNVSFSTQSLQHLPVNQRQSVEKVQGIESGRFMHRNLIFEESELERSGKSLRPAKQLLSSSGKFFWRGWGLPLRLVRGQHRYCQPSIE